MAQRRYWVILGGGAMAAGIAGWIWYSRRPRPVTAPVSPPTQDEQTQLERPEAPPVVLTDARVATWKASALGEQATLTILASRLLLQGPATSRLRLQPSMDVTLAIRVGNGTDQDLDVVIEAELIRTDTGSLVSVFWVGDVRRPQVRIPAHQVATLEWTTIRPAERIDPGTELTLVIAVTAAGRVTRYSGSIFRVEAAPTQGETQAVVLQPPERPERWEQALR